MKNILVLYNPYYQKDVIEQHLQILKERNSVAFGKIKSKLRENSDNPNEEELEAIYDNVSRDNPMQLFLTDYNSIYVANVISVKKTRPRIIKAPKYYDKIDVEMWYIFDDLRLIIKDNFQSIRDNILANFIATNFNNRTYAVYGNKYVYPMQITMKEEINYFDKDNEDFKYYNNIFKSDLEIQTKQSLINYCFTEDVFNTFAPNSQDNLISSEIEYIQNRHNPLYDFSAVVMKYSKIVEEELHWFFKKLFKYLISKNSSIGQIEYSIQGGNYIVEDIFEHKANYGTYKFLLRKNKISNNINNHITQSKIRYFIQNDIMDFIPIMQKIRNESIHENSATIQECQELRNHILGIGNNSFLKAIKEYGKQIDKL